MGVIIILVDFGAELTTGLAFLQINHCWSLIIDTHPMRLLQNHSMQLPKKGTAITQHPSRRYVIKLSPSCFMLCNHLLKLQEHNPNPIFITCRLGRELHSDSDLIFLVVKLLETSISPSASVNYSGCKNVSYF
jgi:hypothetical protein